MYGPDGVSIGSGDHPCETGAYQETRLGEIQGDHVTDGDDAVLPFNDKCITWENSRKHWEVVSLHGEEFGRDSLLTVLLSNVMSTLQI